MNNIDHQEKQYNIIYNLFLLQSKYNNTIIVYADLNMTQNKTNILDKFIQQNGWEIILDPNKQDFIKYNINHKKNIDQIFIKYGDGDKQKIDLIDIKENISDHKIFKLKMNIKIKPY